MSFFEDQEDDWYANDCKGRIEDYDGAGNYAPEKGEDLGPSEEDSKILAALQSAAKGKGLKCSSHANGHFQIRAGRRIVNWYPLSRRQMAYENVTGEKRFGLNAKQVVEFALQKVEAAQ
jgi:hypothetical protein